LAFGTVGVMSDRVCIDSGQADQRTLYAKNLLDYRSSCRDGCSRDKSSYALKYWKETCIV
jgi:uncharacterized membrane protein